MLYQKTCDTSLNLNLTMYKNYFHCFYSGNITNPHNMLVSNYVSVHCSHSM